MEYYETLCYLAHTYFLENEYQQADKLLQEALAAKRLIGPSESVPVAFTDENELKFLSAKCLVKMNEPRMAIMMIDSIPAKQRAPKVNYLYGQLNKNKTTNVAIAAFKEVLKEHQLALDVAEELLELGTSGLEVNSLMVDATHWPQCQDWLANWIEAHSFLAAHDYMPAIQKFQLIENNSSIQNHQRYHRFISLSCSIEGGHRQRLKQNLRFQNSRSNSQMLHVQRLQRAGTAVHGAGEGGGEAGQ